MHANAAGEGDGTLAGVPLLGDDGYGNAARIQMLQQMAMVQADSQSRRN